MISINFLKKKLFTLKPDITLKQERDTGLIVVLVCLLLALFYPPLVWIKIALTAVLITLLWPKAFYPLAVIWFLLAEALSKVSSTVILTSLFIVLVVPVGFMRRVFKKDNLQLKAFKKSSKSVFTHRDHIYEPSDLQHPF